MGQAAFQTSNDDLALCFAKPVDPFLHSDRADYIDIAPGVYRARKVEQPESAADDDAFWAGFKL